MIAIGGSKFAAPAESECPFMIEQLFKGVTKVFGSRNDREVKRLVPRVEAINAREPALQGMSDAELREESEKLRQRVQSGTSLEDVLVEAFALVRETSRRTPPEGAEHGLRHFDVQLIGGMTLHEGSIAEMATGEGKTLVATLPAYLNALTGKGVHVITVNDYLARRDKEWMGRIYEKLGLSVGVIQSTDRNEQRKAAYQADITYGTNNEFGFDYLRDNMKSSIDDLVQRRNYAILDEVDNILIDEARTPLIISGPSEGDTGKYGKANLVAKKLKRDEHFEVKEKESQIILSEEGILEAQRLVGVDSFYAGANQEWPHLIEQSLRAHHLFTIDVDYVVKTSDQTGRREVVIVDEFTGRLMDGRRWSDGLHQAVEAKERITIQKENQTLATITFQNFFKLYNKLGGMTGTAMTEAGEFLKIYGLGVRAIPTNKPIARDDMEDLIYASEKDKFTALVDDILARNKEGRPVLVGTTSIEKSEKISKVLGRRGIAHEVLNAKQHEREAEIVARAGEKGRVTIATNMAGRGTDIKLGGDPELVAQDVLKEQTGKEWDEAEETERDQALDDSRPVWQKAHDHIIDIGGLHVIGTERHESRRIDNQLRGRCGRQGDPGSSRFYLSLDDDLMKRFAGPKVQGMLKKLGLEGGEAIEHKWVSGSVARAQRKVEERNFEIRKRLLEYDEVMNEQRKLIYDYRDRVLRGEDLRELVIQMVGGSLDRVVELYCPAKEGRDSWDRAGLADWIQRKTRLDMPSGLDDSDMVDGLLSMLEKHHDERAERFGAELTEDILRYILLNAIDSRWKEHLFNMDALKSGIGLRAYAQEDPKVAYKKEGYRLFDDMQAAIEDEVMDRVFLVEVQTEDEAEEIQQTDTGTWGGAVASHVSMSSDRDDMEAAAHSQQGVPEEAPKPFVREEVKVGRNEACPCGSGLKYKKCHGA